MTVELVGLSIKRSIKAIPKPHTGWVDHELGDLLRLCIEIKNETGDPEELEFLCVEGETKERLLEKAKRDSFTFTDDEKELK